MADREIEKWITVKGHKVPIYKDSGETDDNTTLYKKLKSEGWRAVRGTMADGGEKVVMVANGHMADGSITYVRGDSRDIMGIEKDGYIRQYQKDRKNVFYLMTEDKWYY